LGPMAKATTLILVADRNRLVAEALMDAFLEVVDVDCTIATSLAKAMLAAQLRQPALVLIDAWISRTGVEDLVRQIKECAPQSQVFVMASRVEPAFEQRAVGAGAAGCCEKESVPRNAKAMLATLGVRA
jgi:DNA-binding NarL/FixJ family response regulator